MGLEVDRKKGSRVALLSSRGLKTFLDTPYLTVAAATSAH